MKQTTLKLASLASFALLACSEPRGISDAGMIDADVEDTSEADAPFDASEADAPLDTSAADATLDTNPDAVHVGEFELVINTAATNPYVVADASEVEIVGEVISSHGVQRLWRDDTPVLTTGANEAFNSPTPISSGMTLVRLRVEDNIDRVAWGHRSILRANYLPSDALAPTGQIAFDQALLTDALGDQAAIDLPSLIRSIMPTIEWRGCVLTMGTPSIGDESYAFTIDPVGNMMWHGAAEDVSAEVEVDCAGDVRTGSVSYDEIGFSAFVSGDAGDECLEGLEHARLVSQIRGPNVVVDEPFDTLLRDALDDATGATLTEQVDALLTTRLTTLSLPGRDGPFDVGDAMPNGDLCILDLQRRDNRLIARLAGSAAPVSALSFDAPGAPMLDTVLPTPEPGSFDLSSNYLTRVLHAAWVGGDLEGESSLIVGDFARYVDELFERFDAGTRMTIRLEPKIAPLATVRDELLEVHVGQIDATVLVGDEVLFRFGAHLIFQSAGFNTIGIRSNFDVQSEGWLLSSAYDVDRETAESLSERIANVAANHYQRLLPRLPLPFPDTFRRTVEIVEGSHLRITPVR